MSAAGVAMELSGGLKVDGKGRRKRSGIRLDVYVPKAIAVLVMAKQKKFGLSKGDVVVAALVRDLAEEQADYQEILKLGKKVLAKMAGER